MTTEEFSDAFDTLVQQQLLNTELQVSEYEKSLFLTQAQNEIVLSLYNGVNATYDSFEKTEEIRRYLAPLVKTKQYVTSEAKDITKVATNSTAFDLPKDIYFIVYEKANISIGSCTNLEVDVVPITHNEYNRIRRNPFKNANNRRALRLDLSNQTVEIINKGTLNNYFIRYISKPSPIILVSLQADNLSIENETKAQTCALHEALHDKILKRAVALAIASKTQYNSKQG